MREPPFKEIGLYSKEEARICLNCSERKCRGTCDRLKRERERIYKESLPPLLYEIDVETEVKAEEVPEEFIIPDTALWPKENPHIPKYKGD